MKVIKAEELPITQNQEKKIDQARVEELREKFDLIQNQLNSKEYDTLLNEEQTTHLMNSVFPNFQWKGYESYAITETYEKLSEIVNKSEGEKSINGKFRPEIIEAIFHFLKNYVSSGVENARIFRQICDQFAIPMTEINQDRQNLKDLSLELVSAEQGIPVEQLIEGLKKQNPSFQG